MMLLPWDMSFSIILEIDDVFKSIVDTIFYSLKDAFGACEKYAKAARFEAWKPTQAKDSKGFVKTKYFVCVKEVLRKGLLMIFWRIVLRG